jgi:hypothetical protein
MTNAENIRSAAEYLATGQRLHTQAELENWYVQLFEETPEGDDWDLFKAAYIKAVSGRFHEVTLTKIIADPPEAPAREFTHQAFMTTAFSTGRTFELIDMHIEFL